MTATTVPPTMPAAVYQGRRTVTVETLPVPDLGPLDVLIGVSHCGICGTDLHFVMDGWGKPGSVHGHEYSGVITATGPEVEDWRPGDRVVGGPARGCGACAPCRSGAEQLCQGRPGFGQEPFQGAFAAYKALGSDSLFRIPDSLDLRTAALAEPVAVALRGVRRAGLHPGQRALVTGAGPIGLITVCVLRALGITDVTVSEPAPARRTRAAELGATVVSPDQLTAPGLPTELVEAPFDAAIECSGRAEAMTTALAQLGTQGTLVLSGTGLVQPGLDAIRIIVHELQITGTYEYGRSDFEDALGMLAAGQLPAAELIEPEDVALSGIQAAMEQLAAGELVSKVMVVPHA